MTCCTERVKDCSGEASPACSELHALRALQTRSLLELYWIDSCFLAFPQVFAACML